ncbi:MAG: DUF1553 domain-containing protein [Planctomycetaceae bacterium]|nr:DUF1553 domain-containing protein [Planctomycetaceae bacterium]
MQKQIRPAILLVLLTSFCGSLSSIHADDADYVEPEFTVDDRDHWSFYPLPEVRLDTTPPTNSPLHDSAAQNPVDEIAQRVLAEHGLSLQPSADVRILVRRASLGLTGLLPSTQLIDEARTAPWIDVVNHMLDSPGYGERWAQHWLDVARFAETDGFEHDKVRPDAWKYRDWVIQAINDDMPYDEFIRQQIAGDLLYPNDPQAAIATHFCVSGPDMPDINSQDERKHHLLNEMTATVGSTVLGLQLGCAQCHDSKYDPISQADFYRIRLIFEPSVLLKKNVSVTRLQRLNDRPVVGHIMLRGDFRRPGPEIQPGIPAVLASEVSAFNEPGISSDPRVKLARWLTDSRNPLTARVAVNRVWQHHFGIGICDTPGDFGIMGQPPSNQELLDWLAAWLIANDWSLKELHRLILTSQVWKQRSKLPDGSSEEELTAWRKCLHVDADCRMLSRFPRQRLEGEVIRDVMLQAAGTLNRKTGGPGVRPPLPAELRSTLLKNQWDVTPDTTEHSRRSIYVFARRNLRYPIFEAFDRPSANQSCPLRNVSTTATQALHLLNSEFAFEIATGMARRIQDQLAQRTASSGEPADAVEVDRQIALAFEILFQRSPTIAETKTARLFFQESSSVDDSLSSVADGSLSVDENRTTLTNFCLCLLNSNEFVVID